MSKTINTAGLPDLDLTVVARVSRLIRVVGAGLVSLALAIGLLLVLVFWRDRR